MCWKKIWCKKHSFSTWVSQLWCWNIFFWITRYNTYALTVNHLCSFVIIGICSTTRINVIVCICTIITMLRYARFYMRSDRNQPSCLRLSLAFSVSEYNLLIHVLFVDVTRCHVSLSFLWFCCCSVFLFPHFRRSHYWRSRLLLFAWMPLKR